MSNYVKKTPDVSVEGLNDDHRPSATSKSESLSSSAISKDELPCPETAHRHGVPTYNDANQIEKAEATAPCSDPSPPSNGNDNPSSREDAKDKCGWRRSCCSEYAGDLLCTQPLTRYSHDCGDSVSGHLVTPSCRCRDGPHSHHCSIDLIRLHHHGDRILLLPLQGEVSTHSQHPTSPRQHLRSTRTLDHRHHHHGKLTSLDINRF